jgi:hypothetical protein
MVVPINALQGLHSESEVARCLPQIRPVLHQPRGCRMSQGVGGHAAFQPGVFNGMLERLINAGDRRAPPLDRVAFADSKTLPPAKMRQEPVGNASWRLSLFRFSLSLRAAVEHTSVKVDPSGAIRRSQRGFTNRTGSGSGIKTYQDETGGGTGVRSVYPFGLPYSASSTK